ncbi:hypothetical protein D9M69_706910 [compost metagenome]
MAGDQDHRQVAIEFQQLVQQLQAIGAGHAHIADHHPGEIAVDQRQGLGRTGAALHAKPRELQPLLHRLADRRFIVDDYHLPGHITS